MRYCAEEFEELHPGEDYLQYQRHERQFIEALAREGLGDRVVFQEIESVGYYKYLAKTGLENNDSTRAAYAASIYDQD